MRISDWSSDVCSSDLDRKAKEDKAQPKAEAKYPEATREEPEAKASAKLSKDLKKIFDAYEADDAASVVPLADEMIANEKANAYERSISARLEIGRAHV